MGATIHIATLLVLMVSDIALIIYLINEKRKRKKGYGYSPDMVALCVWDAFLTAERQNVGWRDEDTCNLIVKKLSGESEIEYADPDNLPYKTLG